MNFKNFKNCVQEAYCRCLASNFKIRAFLLNDFEIFCSDFQVPKNFIIEFSDMLQFENVDNLAKILWNISINPQKYVVKKENSRDVVSLILNGLKACKDEFCINSHYSYFPKNRNSEFFSKFVTEENSIFFECLSFFESNPIIYTFDDDFFSDILNCEDLSQYDFTIFQNLPFENFLIISQNRDKFYSSLVHYDSLNSSLKISVTVHHNNSHDIQNFIVDDMSVLDDIPVQIKFVFKQIVYLCILDADICVTSRERCHSITKKTGYKITSFDIGYNLGSVLRNYKKMSAEYEKNGSNKSKRPHLRRGHFHSFWKNDENGKKQLIVKWIKPVIVNAGADVAVTVHDVR